MLNNYRIYKALLLSSALLALSPSAQAAPLSAADLCRILSGIPGGQLHTIDVPTDVILAAFAEPIEEQLGYIQDPRERCALLITMHGFIFASRDAVVDAARDAVVDAAWTAAWTAARDAAAGTIAGATAAGTIAGAAAWAAARAAARGATERGANMVSEEAKRVVLLYFLRDVRQILRASYDAALAVLPVDVANHPFITPEAWLAFRARHFGNLDPEAMRYLDPFLQLVDEQTLPFIRRLEHRLFPPGSIAEGDEARFLALDPAGRDRVGRVLTPFRGPDTGRVLDLRRLAAARVPVTELEAEIARNRGGEHLIPEALLTIILGAHRSWAPLIFSIMLARASTK